MARTYRKTAHRNAARARSAARAIRLVPLSLCHIPDGVAREGSRNDNTRSHLTLLKGDFLDPKQNQE